MMLSVEDRDALPALCHSERLIVSIEIAGNAPHVILQPDPRFRMQPISLLGDKRCSLPFGTG